MAGLNPNMTLVKVDLTVTTTIVAAVAGKRVSVIALCLTGGTQVVRFQTSTGPVDIAVFSINALAVVNLGMASHGHDQGVYFETLVGDGLIINVPGGVALQGFLVCVQA